MRLEDTSSERESSRKEELVGAVVESFGVDGVAMSGAKREKEWILEPADNARDYEWKQSCFNHHCSFQNLFYPVGFLIEF